MPDEGDDSFGVALQNLSRENDGGAKIRSRSRRNVEGARTVLEGGDEGVELRERCSVRGRARVDRCRAPRTVPLPVHGRHLDVDWRVVASRAARSK